MTAESAGTPVDRPTVFVPQPVNEAALGWLADHAGVRRGFGPDAERRADAIEQVDGLLFALDNVVLSPHRAGRTREVTQNQGGLAARRLVAVLRGEGRAGAVNDLALETRAGSRCGDCRTSMVSLAATGGIDNP